MLSSLSDLLRCEPLDLTAEQSLLANPFNIALGRADGQYMRGGILSSLLLLILLSVVICAVTVPASMVTLRREFRSSISLDGDSSVPAPTWADAVAHTHLPGVLIVPMALVGESWVQNGATLVSMSGVDVGDIVLGTAALVAFWAYVAHLVVTVRGAPVKLVRLKSKRSRRRMSTWLHYWLESPVALQPTDKPNIEGPEESMLPKEYTELLAYEPLHKMLSGELGPHAQRSSRYYLRYAPYVDELNVLWFKVAELTLGNVINLASGIDTDSCFLQGFFVVVCVGLVLVLIVWKRPLAVRGQLLTTGIVYGSMFVAAVVVLVNLFAQHSTLEDAATVLLLVSTAFTVLQSATDLLISAVSAYALFRKFVVRIPRSRKANRMLLDDLGVGDRAHMEEFIDRDSSSSTSTPVNGGENTVLEEGASGWSGEDTAREDAEFSEANARRQILRELEEEDSRKEAVERDRGQMWLGFVVQ